MQVINRVSLTKDLSVYVFTITLLLFLIIDDNIIDFYDSLILSGLFPLYIGLNWCMSHLKWFKEAERAAGNPEDLQDESVLPTYTDTSSREMELETSHNHKKVIFYSPESEGFTNLRSSDNRLLAAKEEEEAILTPESPEILLPASKSLRAESTLRKASSIWSHVCLFLAYPFERLFAWTIPKQNPVHTFLVSLLYIFIFTQYTLFSVKVLSDFFHLPLAFLGLVFSAWGNNIGDLATALISSKNEMASQAASSLFGTQIINIQLSLAFPWLIKNAFFAPVQLVDPSIPSSIEIIIGSLLILYVILSLGRMRLSIANGWKIILIYLVFIFWEFIRVKKSKG